MKTYSSPVFEQILFETEKITDSSVNSSGGIPPVPPVSEIPKTSDPDASGWGPPF